MRVNLGIDLGRSRQRMKPTSTLICTAALAVCGCSAHPDPIIDPTGVNMTVYEEDLAELPEAVRQEMEFVLVDDLTDAQQECRVEEDRYHQHDEQGPTIAERFEQFLAEDGADESGFHWASGSPMRLRKISVRLSPSVLLRSSSMVPCA